MNFTDAFIDAVWVRDPAAAPLNDTELRELFRAFYRPWLRGWVATFYAWLRAEP